MLMEFALDQLDSNYYSIDSDDDDDFHQHHQKKWEIEWEWKRRVEEVAHGNCNWQFKWK